MNDTTSAPNQNSWDLRLCPDYVPSSKLVEGNHVVFGVLNICLAIATILLNSTTIVACMKSRILKCKMAYFMVMMLSFNDLIVGLTSNVLFAAILFKEYGSKSSECLLNRIQIFLLLLFSGCSFKTLVVMSWERYAAICHPLYHRTKVTRKRLMKCLIFLWFFAIVGTVLSSLFQTFFNYVIIPELAAFITFLLYVYIKIYLANSTKSSINITEGRQDADLNNRLRDQQRKAMLNTKLAKSCFLAVISFVICYLPSGITTSGAFKFQKDLGVLVLVWAKTLILLNSSLNSIVFFWRSKPLREEAYAVVKCNRREVANS